MDDQGRGWPQPPQAPQQNVPQPPAGMPVQNYSEMGPAVPPNSFGVPPVAPNEAFAPQPPIPVRPKKPRKKLIIAGSIAAILTVLIGGGALAYAF